MLRKFPLRHCVKNDLDYDIIQDKSRLRILYKFDRIIQILTIVSARAGFIGIINYGSVIDGF